MKRQISWWLVAVVVIVGIVALIWWRVDSRPDYPAVTSPRPTLGSDTASVQLEEFSDFQCPACKAALPAVDEVIATFGDRVKFSYRHFPLVEIHTQAFRAALAAECANDQGKFWEYHNKLFEVQPNFARNELVGYAGELELKLDGLDGFTACLDSRAKTDVVRADMREGNQRSVRGTPTFYLNGEAVADWSQLKSLIQGKLTGG